MMCGGVGSAKPADDEVRSVLNEVHNLFIFLPVLIKIWWDPSKHFVLWTLSKFSFVISYE